MQESLLYRNEENIKKESDTFSDPLYKLAFDNSLQPNIVFTAFDGSICRVNKAACKLLGYSKKELLDKSRSLIFDITPGNFKKNLILRSAKAQSGVLVTAIKNNGVVFPCEITSAFFVDEDGSEKVITTLADVSLNLRKQKKIYTSKTGIMLAKNNKLIKKLDKIRETERLKIEIELSDNISQLLCASLIYINLAKRGEENIEAYLNHSSQYTLTAIEKIKKVIKQLTSSTKQFRAVVVT